MAHTGANRIQNCKEFLCNLKRTNRKIWAEFNAGATLINEKGYWGHFYMHLVRKAIANLLFVP